MKLLIDMSVLAFCGFLLGFYVSYVRDQIVRDYINRQPKRNRHATDLIETCFIALVLVLARHLGT